MAKVITFSRVFPNYHPKAGQPTYFVEAIYKALYLAKVIPPELEKTYNQDAFLNGFTKYHTIRSGNRFKKGDFFSPRVWGDDINPRSGKKGPYHSKQIILASDVKIKNVWNIEMFPNNEIHINGIHFASFGSENCRLISKNDGLEMKDFISWFSKPHFKGQIICWDESVSYD